MLDNESKERTLVGEMIATVAKAGQISRELSVSDHGIDMEIEFKSDAGEATGRKVYLQLKSGDSYLRRRRNGAEVFTLKDERHARYWRDQAFPVMLVIRNADGDIRWMEVRDWLRREGVGGKPVKQIVFAGKPFDVQSVHRWREEALRPEPVIAPAALANLPAPRPRFGRDDLFTDLVATLLAAEPQPTPILGPPGVGKSHLTICAFHDPAVAAKYGERRYFVRCDGAATAEAALGEIAKALGMPLGPDLAPRVRHHLAAGPVALALDNFETPWEREEVAAESLLEQLVAPTVALIVSLRGKEMPLRPSWRPAIEVSPLLPPPARELFVRAAGGKHGSDPHLEDFVKALDGLPVALELLGHAAQSEDDLASLWRRWLHRKTALLKRGRGGEKETNAEISFEISIEGPRMTDPARRLLSLLAKLPAGIGRLDFESLLPGEGDEAAAVLRGVGLAFNEERRLRALAPIRNFVAREHPPGEEDWERSLAHYYALAETLGPKVGAEGGAEAAARLSAETGNLESLIHEGLESTQPHAAIDAAIALTNFLRLTGLGSATLLRRAAETARLSADAKREAQALRSLGGLHLRRSDRDAAWLAYELALALYQQIGDLLGQANCTKHLGDIHLRRWNHAAAQLAYEQALALFQRVGDLHGQASCTKSLGNIDFDRSNYAAARLSYEQALTLYQQADEMRGQAICTERLGDIHLRRSDHATARGAYEQALSLYRQGGDVLGQANCTHHLGDIHLLSSDHASARLAYEQALPLYQQVGDLLGQANCSLGFGEIALTEGNRPLARKRFRDALEGYAALGDRYSIGRAHSFLARAAGGEEERRRHVEVAREIWTTPDLLHFVGELDREFGPSAPKGRQRKRRG